MGKFKLEFSHYEAKDRILGSCEENKPGKENLFGMEGKPRLGSLTPRVLSTTTGSNFSIPPATMLKWKWDLLLSYSHSNLVNCDIKE
jgi:hypothetical protein